MSRDKKRIEAILKQVFAGGGPPLVGVSYERVSSHQQVSGTSLETQPLDIQHWAERHSIRIIKHYVDRGRSGRSANRAAYQQMLAELAELKVQVVLVWKLDRFARNMLLQLQKIEEFNALGVALVSITKMIDYTTAMGKQQMALASMFAQTYSDQLGERMERALRHTAEQGYWSARRRWAMLARAGGSRWP
jgi:site-specific DNA recombinase